MRKNERQPSQYGPPSEPNEGAYFLLALIIFLVIYALSACSSMGAREPVWEPHLYYPTTRTGQLFFEDMLNPYSVPVSCKDQAIDDFVLIPAEDLITLKEKMQRCAKWE